MRETWKLLILFGLLDPNQEEGSKTRYKMISRVDGNSGHVSADGIAWDPVATNPLLSKGPFDSHKFLLWDDERERYVIYLRGVDPSVPGRFKGGRRAIRRSESSDFLHWTEPKLVFTADEQDPPNFHLATSRYKPRIAEEVPDEDPVDLNREVLAIEFEITAGLEKLLSEVEKQPRVQSTSRRNCASRSRATIEEERT